MKKTIWFMILIFVLLGFMNVYAGGVTDDNNGNQGYILVSTGVNNGSNSEGHWTNPNCIPSLKGDKGDKGDKGEQGIQGFKGDKGDKGDRGIQGIAGKDGKNGINGLNGNDGINGMNGLDGDKGDKGDKGDIGLNGKDVDPAVVNNLEAKDTNLQNNINNTNSRIDNLDGRVNKLEKTQYTIRTEVKFVREKHLEVGVYSVYSQTRSKMSEIGLNIVVPVGESYQDREFKRINSRLANIERKLGSTAVIEKTLDNQGHIKSMSISSGKVAFGGDF